MDIAFWLEILLFVLLLGFSAFFSSSETSLFSLTERQLAQMRQRENPRIGLIERMLNEPRRLIITILIGNELVNVSASVVSAAVVISLLGAENKFVNLLIMVPILLLVGEITPKTMAIRNNVAFATFQSRPIDAFARLITPLRWVVRKIADFFTTLLVGRQRARGSIVTEDMLRTLADEAVGEGELDILEARTIGQIFEFGDKTVQEEMTPRASISYLSIEMSPSDMVEEIRLARFSKFPVNDESRDNIVGILYARDLLGQDLDELARSPEAFRRVLRTPYFVPETKPVSELFQAFRRRKLSLALTVDEFGGVTGLVTMEDLLECIFGEIYSPSDGRQEFGFESVEGDQFRVSGAMPLADFVAEAKVPFDEDVAETLGGLLLHEHGELPPEGAVLELAGIRFTVDSVQDNRIHSLLVERLDGEGPRAEPVADGGGEQATMDLGITLTIIAVFLLLEGFFSGSELGIVSSDPMKLRHMAAKGSRGARLALKMLEKPEWLLSTTLVGTNIAVVSNTTLVTALMIERFGERGSVIAVVVVAPLIWIFGEIVPKSVCQQKANVLTPWVIFPLRAASILFSPLLLVFTGLTRTLSRVVGERPLSPFTLREELLTMLQMSAHESDIQPDEQDMIRRLFDFSETTAREVMVPLLDVAAIEEGATCGEAIRVAAERSHSRLPVFRQRVDRVVGILNALELLGGDPEAPVRSFVREIDYVPGSKSVRDLLLEFRQGASAMSVVVDEFGGAEGIVTIEDVMEEVVAEIQDEFDHGEKDPQWIRKLGERHYMVSGRVEVDTLQHELGLEIPRGKYASVAGFLLERVKDVPEQGEVIEWQGITFTIHRALPHLIQEVRIQW